jgi:acyl-CoA synthetase (AMP-forming)/AMP-acid ligase II/thioesterase domain-containing protein/acyl carrier protein
MTTLHETNRSHRSLAEYVRTHATLQPHAPALVAAARPTCTYGQLDAHLDRLCATLAELSPTGDAVIAVAASGGPELFTAIVAAMCRGICAPFDPSRPTAEIDAFLAEIKPALVLADDGALLRHQDAFHRNGVGIVRMSTTAAAPAGIFDVFVEEPLDEPSARPAREATNAGDDVVLLLCSSGTTALAKIVPHTLPGLMHIFNEVVATIDLRSTDRCLNAAPLYHVHGIVHVIGASLVAGASVIWPAEISAAAIVEAMRTEGATWYTSSPPIHRAILSHTRRAPQPVAHSLRFIRSSSAPLDPQVAAALEVAFGVPLLEGYGTTEAPSATLNPPAARKLGSVGRALGCEIAIFDGEVGIRGANVAPSYANGWYLTGDAGHIDADGYLYITGRLNELINVGGQKVAPGDAEAALLTHPAVADAVAFSLPHPTLGEHVAAVVVLRPEVPVTMTHLIEHAALLLPRAAVPFAIHPVAAIERDASGKVRRRELTAKFARNPHVVQAATLQAGDDASLQAIARIWEDVLEYAPVALDENFFAAGGDSLRAISVMTRIEADLGISLSMDMLLFAPTIRELAQAVLAEATTTRRNRIVALRTTGSRPPLFFYDSDVNSGGLYSRFLLSALDSEQPVYVVRPNGALGDEIPESIELMADADAAMIAMAVPSQSYRLAGFCAGGIVAFEVARRLESAGYTVDVVTLVSSSAPNALLEPLWKLTSRLSGTFSKRGHAIVYKALRSLANALRTRSSPADIMIKLRELRRPPAPQSPAEQVYSDRLLHYFPKPTARSVDLIWADDDAPRLSGDPTMGWRHVADVRRYAVAGDHVTVLTEHLAELGAVVRRIFDAADRVGV